MSVKQTNLHFLLEYLHIKKHALIISRISRNMGIFSMDVQYFNGQKSKRKLSEGKGREKTHYY